MIALMANKSKRFRCRNCKTDLGSVVGQRLVIGGASFTRNVTIECTTCATMIRWSPKKKKPLDRNG